MARQVIARWKRYKEKKGRIREDASLPPKEQHASRLVMPQPWGKI